MARITVEDCEKIVKNRFDLVVLAAQRTRQIINGDPITIEINDEKKPVIALREIAAKTVSTEALKDSLINSYRSFIPSDMDEEDIDSFEEEDTYNPYIGNELQQNATEVEIVSGDQSLEDMSEEDDALDSEDSFEDNEKDFSEDSES